MANLLVVTEDYEAQRKARNMAWHLQDIAEFVKRLERRPCITNISAMRIALDLMERDIKKGDAA